MRNPRSVNRAEVFQDQRRVGTLSRTKHGAVFEYDDGYFAAGDERGIAVHLPGTQKRFEITGVNLHPFFAGLLPEGLRLTVLVQRLKTSEDDLLSLLIATGADCVGDVWVVAEGEAPEQASAAPTPTSIEEASFRELFEESLARAGVKSREPAIPGVQEKLSAAKISFPVGVARARSAYILKLNPPKYPLLVENEAFFMKMARDCGLEVASTRIVRDRDGEAGLLVERFDRVWSREEKRLRRIHQEDACQLLDRYPADKYRLSLREIAEALEVCAAPIVEQTRLIQLLAFSWLIGNGDLHGKNVSVGALGPRGGLSLTPAYDLLSTLPYGDRRMALKVDGRDDNLTGKTFLTFAERLGLKPAAIRASLEALRDRAAPWKDRLEEIGLTDQKTEDLRRVMTRRAEQLVTGLRH